MYNHNFQYYNKLILLNYNPVLYLFSTQIKECQQRHRRRMQVVPVVTQEAKVATCRPVLATICLTTRIHLLTTLPPDQSSFRRLTSI